MTFASAAASSRGPVRAMLIPSVVAVVLAALAFLLIECAVTAHAAESPSLTLESYSNASIAIAVYLPETQDRETFHLVRDTGALSPKVQVWSGQGTDGVMEGDSKIEVEVHPGYILVGKEEWASAILSNDEPPHILSAAVSSKRIGGTFTFKSDNQDEGRQNEARRLEQAESLPFQDVAIFHPDHPIKIKKKEDQLKSSLEGASSDNIFYPGCYPGDNTILRVEIGVATDVGYNERVTSAYPNANAATKRNLITQEIEKTISLLRPFYLAQLNVDLQVTNIVIGDTSSSSAQVLRNRRGNCPADPHAELTLFSNWARTAPKVAHWHLFTDCYPSGVVGAGYIATLCSNFGGHVAFSSWSSSHWLTVVHEIGHVFGAYHTFYNGRGGIMDYGSGRLNGGAVQFHPENRPDMCAELTEAINARCPNVKHTQGTSECGNGVLEPDEQCECTSGSTSCGACSKCKLTSSRQCSTTADGFVIRHPSTAPYVSTRDESLIAHTDCCSKGALNSRTCNGGRDVCSPTGTCSRTCWTYLLSPCGFDTENDCIQRCLSGGKCYGAELTTIGPPPIPAGAVPDGLSCRLPGSSAMGECRTGVCVPSSTSPPTAQQQRGTSAPTLRPTLQPTLKPTPQPTLNPTAKPSLQPTSMPTQKPTTQPTAKPTLQPTSKPTQPPPTSKPTTLAPTTPQPTVPTSAPTIECPSEEKFMQCARTTKAKPCQNAKGCKWCAASKECRIDFAGVCAYSYPDFEILFGHCNPFLRKITIAA